MIGPNGCGKTTLLRILAGKEQPSTGHVSRDPSLRIGYLPQGFKPDQLATLGEIIGQAAWSPEALETELASTATALARAGISPGLKNWLEIKYDELLRRIGSAETGELPPSWPGWAWEGSIPMLPVGRLSGGQKARLALALVLLGEPELMLLDEPTNLLDISMLEWLKKCLRSYQGGVLIVSHDRTFLDHTVSQILDMDAQKHSVRLYTGNYSAYLEQKQAEYDKQWADFKDQQQEIRQMKKDIARTRAQAEFTERQASSVRIGGPEMKNKGLKLTNKGSPRKSQEKPGHTRRSWNVTWRQQRVQKPQRSWQMRLEFGKAPHLGRSVIPHRRIRCRLRPDSTLVEGIEPVSTLRPTNWHRGANGGGKTTLSNVLGRSPSIGGGNAFRGFGEPGIYVTGPIGP